MRVVFSNMSDQNHIHVFRDEFKLPGHLFKTDKNCWNLSSELQGELGDLGQNLSLSMLKKLVRDQIHFLEILKNKKVKTINLINYEKPDHQTL